MYNEAIEAGGAAPAVLNAANEIAVEAFLNERIGFTRITAVAESVLARYMPSQPATMEDVLAIDAEAREHARAVLEIPTLV